MHCWQAAVWIRGFMIQRIHFPLWKFCPDARVLISNHPHLHPTSNVSWCFSFWIASRPCGWHLLTSLYSELGLSKAVGLPSWHKGQKSSGGGLMIFNSQQEHLQVFLLWDAMEGYCRCLCTMTGWAESLTSEASGCAVQRFGVGPLACNPGSNLAGSITL